MSHPINKFLSAAAATVAVLAASSVTAQAEAAVVVLDFEGLGNLEPVQNFYNGGAGTNYGVSFGNRLLGLINLDSGGSGRFANEPSPDTVALLLNTVPLVMNVADGFDTGFSFYYSSSQMASVTVWSELGATGTMLATLELEENYQDNCTPTPTSIFCNWDPIGVSFMGTAKSVSFMGMADNRTGFDNITLGSATPGNGETVPEPASALGLLAIGAWGAGSLLKGRKKQ